MAEENAERDGEDSFVSAVQTEEINAPSGRKPNPSTIDLYNHQTSTEKEKLSRDSSVGRAFYVEEKVKLFDSSIPKTQVAVNYLFQIVHDFEDVA